MQKRLFEQFYSHVVLPVVLLALPTLPNLKTDDLYLRNDLYQNKSQSKLLKTFINCRVGIKFGWKPVKDWVAMAPHVRLHLVNTKTNLNP